MSVYRIYVYFAVRLELVFFQCSEHLLYTYLASFLMNVLTIRHLLA
jgi:hypothetical protein